MKKPLFRAALVTSTLAAVLLPATVAQAQTVAVVDEVGDVWKMTYDEATQTETEEPAGSQVNADLLRTVVKHTARKVVLTGRYAELTRNDNRFAFVAKIRTNEGLKREVGVETFSKSGWGGAAYVAKANGSAIRCRGLVHEIDYAANTVTVAVPRACVSAPKWVQVSVGAFALTEDPNAMVAYVDNGHNDTAQEPATWSARVRKG